MKRFVRRFGVALLTLWLSLGLLSYKLHAYQNSPFSFVSVANVVRIVFNYPVETMQAIRFNNIRFIGFESWIGDIGAQANAAYADLPPNGGTIYVLENPNSTYQFTTPILFTTQNKPVLLLGTGVAGTSQNNGGTVLEFTPASGCAITQDYTNSSGSNTIAHGIRDLSLWNGHTFAAGVGNGAKGICVGSTNGGAGQAEYSNLNVEGFTTGFDASTAAQVGWGSLFHHVRFSFNTTAISGGNWENIVIDGSSHFLSNGTGFLSTQSTELSSYSTSWDGNTVIGVNYTAAASPVTVVLVGNHFENPTCTTPNQVQGTANFYIFGGIWEQDCTTSNGNWGFSFSGYTAYVSGLELASAGQTMTQVFLLNSPVRAYLSPVNNAPTVLTAMVGGANATNATQMSVNSNASNNPANWVFEAQSLQINGGLPTCSTTGTGTGPSCAAFIGSTNTVGTLQITTGTAPGASGTVVVTFNGGGVAPHIQTCFGAMNQGGAGQWNARATVFSNPTTNASNTFNWDNNAVSLAATTIYRFDYQCWMK